MGAGAVPAFSQQPPATPPAALPQNLDMLDDSLNAPNLPTRPQTQRQKSTDQLLEDKNKNQPDRPAVDSRLTNPEEPAAGMEEVKIVLQELVVSGVTQIEADRLEEKFLPWIGKRVGLQDLLTIAGEITELYKDEGYVTTRAIVPPQQVENGTVHIHVVEGKIGEIKIEGNKWVDMDYIRKRIDAQAGDVFRLQSLEEDVVALNRNTLFDRVHATLKPGDKPGTSDVVVSVDDHFPVHLSLSIDNFGRENIGLYRPGITLSHENLTGNGDSLVSNVTLASDTVSNFVQYSYPLTDDGWTIGGQYAYSRIVIDDDQVAPVEKIIGRSHRFQLNMGFPLYTSEDRRWQATGDVSGYLVDSMVFIDTNQPFADQFGRVFFPGRHKLTSIVTDEYARVRAITSGININHHDNHGRWVLRGSMTNGVTLFGGNWAFTKFNTDLTRVQDLTHGFVGILRAQGQFTPNRLPGLEQMQIGGANTVRGYPEGFLLADNGYLFSGEFRFPMNFLLPEKIDHSLQGLVFADYGNVFTTGRPAQTLGGHVATGSPGGLFSYGVGVRGQITKHLSGRFDLGIATRNDSPDLWAHFSINSQLF